MNNTAFPALPVSEHVWWVGAADWNVRNFHGYRTGRGSTYNAFLIVDDHVTLIDAVKAPFVSEMLERIRSVIDPEQVDFIISDHSEPDHSGGLRQLIDAVKPQQVFASTVGVKTLKAYYGEDLELTAVTPGSSLDLGQGKLHFADTKMLHWPDSMISYYDRDKVLFSQDAFGMHLAGSKLWADEYPAELLDYEARKYYANILNLQSPKVLTILDALPRLNWDIAAILPDHGPLWRRDLNSILQLYRELAENRMTPRATVVYSTMWHATEKMASALAEGIREAGIPVKVLDLAENDRSEVMTEVASSGLVAFGAPTMNNQMYPAMADVLCYLKGLKVRNKLAFAFGAYGWSGEGAKQIAAELTAMTLEQPCELFQVKYMPDAPALLQLRETGCRLGRELLERCRQS